MTTAEVTGKCTLFEGCKVNQVKNKQGTRGQDTRQFGGETYSNYPIHPLSASQSTEIIITVITSKPTDHRAPRTEKRKGASAGGKLTCFQQSNLWLKCRTTPHNTRATGSGGATAMHWKKNIAQLCSKQKCNLKQSQWLKIITLLHIHLIYIIFHKS